MQQPYGQQQPQQHAYAPGMRPDAAVHAAPESRGKFIERTYMHLAGAIFAFVGLEALIFNTAIGQQFAVSLLELMAVSRYAWLGFLGAFMIAGTLANMWAHSSRSQGMQYLGLGLYVLAEVVIFCPLLMIANWQAQQHGGSIILPAGVTTLAVFTGITGYVFISKQNFSWLRGGLVAASIASIVVIVLATIFGFHLGLLFMGLMVLLAAGYVLYTTSNILHEYGTHQHVAASLALFAAIALMFWYILQIFMSRN